MSRAQLIVSLQQWRRRRAAFRKAEKRVKASRRGSAEWKKRRARKYRLLAERADRMVRLRRWQLKRRPVKPAKPKPVPMRLRAWAEAEKLVGTMESGGNNSGPKVLEIIRANGGVGPEPWCGDFVAWCYRRAGSKAVTRAWAAVRFLGYVTGMRPHPARRMLRGDIVVFTFDHTGLFGEYRDAAGRRCDGKNAAYILTIEGNTGRVGAVSDSATGGDGVYRKLRPIRLVARGVRVTK